MDLRITYAQKDQSFKDFLWKNRNFIGFLLCCITVEFFLFKLCYPFPDFFSDSYSYIYVAFAHLNVNIWPIGYSKFLDWLPFTRSHTALVWVQFYLLELSALYFFLTMIYFFPFRRLLKRITIVVLFCNPLLFYVVNYVTSDALFTAISLVWLTQLIWIINRPQVSQIFTQGLLLFLAFTVRYNAMYYPVIAALAFLFSHRSTLHKWVGILVGPIAIFCFILFSRSEAKEMTGTAQFPILSGWQWANNALYMREYIDVDSNAFPTKETAELDRLARNFFRTVPPEQRDLPNYVANYFMRESIGPLKKYLHRNFPIHDRYTNTVAWGQASPIMGQYGLFLIKRHPGSFVRHYMLVNTKNYFLPPLEKLEIYNLGSDSVLSEGVKWFSLSTPRIFSISKYLQGVLLLPYPTLFLLLNVAYLAVIGMFLARFEREIDGGPKTTFEDFVLTAILITALLILNAGFSIFANIIVIRYQVFPMLVFVSFGCLLLEMVLRRSPGIFWLTEAGTSSQNNSSYAKPLTTTHAANN